MKPFSLLLASYFVGFISANAGPVVATPLGASQGNSVVQAASGVRVRVDEFIGTPLAGPVIATPLGAIQGNAVVHAASGTRVDEFIGIPYAKPPTGDRRFRPAQAVDAWSTTLDATAYGAVCPQWTPPPNNSPNNPPNPPPNPPPNNPLLFKHRSMSEDCLNLNIWKRAGVTPTDKLPVLFFIHGGGFTSGSGSLYNGTDIVAEAARANKDVVVVTVNYRLGGLGMLASEAFAKENGAWPSTGGANFLNDQIVALKFTRALVGSFGGDVDRVMVFGESAGALSTCMLTLVPSAEGLFSSALIESGPCTGPWGPALEGHGLATSAAYMQGLNATTPAALRALPWEAFVGDAPMPEDTPHPIPSVDGFVLPEHPNELFAAGGPVNPSRVVVGSNAFDSLAAKPFANAAPGHPQPTTPAQFLALLMFANLSSSVATTVMNSYIDPPTKFGSVQQGWVKLTADVCVICPSAFLSTTYGKTGAIGTSTPPAVWEYEFAGPGGLSPHAGELPYVFGPGFAELVCGPHAVENLCPSPFNNTLSRHMMAAWRAYAYGDSPWLAHSENKAYRFFGDGTEVTGFDMRGAQCAALAKNLSFMQQVSLCIGL
jgi:para-nitrobenzyl esterase